MCFSAPWQKSKSINGWITRWIMYDPDIVDSTCSNEHELILIILIFISAHFDVRECENLFQGQPWPWNNEEMIQWLSSRRNWRESVRCRHLYHLQKLISDTRIANPRRKRFYLKHSTMFHSFWFLFIFIYLLVLVGISLLGVVSPHHTELKIAKQYHFDRTHCTVLLYSELYIAFE